MGNVALSTTAGFVVGDQWVNEKDWGCRAAFPHASTGMAFEDGPANVDFLTTGGPRIVNRLQMACQLGASGPRFASSADQFCDWQDWESPDHFPLDLDVTSDVSTVGLSVDAAWLNIGLDSGEAIEGGSIWNAPEYRNVFYVRSPYSLWTFSGPGDSEFADTYEEPSMLQFESACRVGFEIGAAMRELQQHQECKAISLNNTGPFDIEFLEEIPQWGPAYIPGYQSPIEQRLSKLDEARKRCLGDGKDGKHSQKKQKTQASKHANTGKSVSSAAAAGGAVMLLGAFAAQTVYYRRQAVDYRRKIKQLSKPEEQISGQKVTVVV